MNLPDRQLFGKGPKGQYNYYTSDYLLKKWSRGHVLITDVTYETCSYCARYVLKKVDPKKRNFFEDVGIVSEFSLMSRSPGIGRNFYDAHPEIFDTVSFSLSTKKKGIQVKPPRYFKNLLEVDDPERYQWFKENSKLAAELRKGVKLAEMSYSELEELEIEERLKERQMKLCVRKMI